VERCFNKNESGSDGYRSQCKKCDGEYQKRYRQQNPEKARERVRQYRIDHPEHMANWHKENREREREYSKKHYQAHREKKLEYSRQYRLKHPEKVKEDVKRWREANPDKVLGHRRSRALKHGYAISNRMRSNMWRCLKERKGGSSWESLVGYTLDDLIAHLESQFTKGMSWENIGEWHIDHIRPVADFNFKTPDDPEFHECWSLWNLQPLWAEENKSKGYKCDAPPLPLLAT